MRHLFEYFVRFKELVGRKIYLLLIWMFMVGFVEGLGITLFLPILEGGFGNDKLSTLMKAGFALLGLEYSFNMILLLILAVIIMRAVFLIVYSRYSTKLSQDLIVRLRTKTLNQIFEADYLYILKKEAGFINNIMVREVEQVVDAFSKFASLLNFALFGLIYLGLAMVLNIRMAISVMVFGSVFAALLVKQNLLINRLSVETSRAYGAFHSILFQVLSKLKYLKATLSTSNILNKVDKANRGLGDLNYKAYFRQAVLSIAFEPLIVFVVLGLLYYQVTILGKGASEVIFLALLFYQVARQFMNAQSGYRKFLSSIGSIEVFKNIQKELSLNQEKLNPEGIAPDFDKDIVFRDVSIVFPNGKKALCGVDLKIRARAFVALVGHSGSGKSTIANLVTGILKPTSGDIYFGQAPYSSLNLRMLRQDIGYVTQEDIIFNASIKDNITLWGGNEDDQRLHNVIEMAHITRFVSGLKDRENEMLGDNGLDISGGQRQRVTIARELYKDARLLILDEATSSLDSKSEKAIYENMRRYKGEKTMLVIAHRLSTIKNADYIYVFDEGKIVEEGTYEELVSKTGEFKKMIDDQKLLDGADVKVAA